MVYPGSAGQGLISLGFLYVYLRANHISQGVVFFVDCEYTGIRYFCILFYLNSVKRKQHICVSGLDKL